MKRVEKRHAIGLFAIAFCLLGVYIPFDHSLAIIEVFYLIVPILLALIISFIAFLGYLLFNRDKLKKAWLPLAIVPLFIASQILSILAVKGVQRFRSNQLISEVQEIKTTSGEFPDSYVLWPGISYTKKSNGDSFTVQYYRGFLIQEEYSSNKGDWTSLGWND